MTMVFILLALLFWVLLPYALYSLALAASGSAAIAWFLAILSVPLGIYAYVRAFENVKKRMGRRASGRNHMAPTSGERETND